MVFSDWITFVSILSAVLIAAFRFDEWEIIHLKQGQKYFLGPILFLIFAGVAAYFQANPHPHFLDFFWLKNGLEPGLWSIIWMLVFLLSAYYSWTKFTNKPPSINLIKKYIDYLEYYEPSRFSSLFRKYEKYFFNSNDNEVWLQYQPILTDEKWWSIASSYFKELVFKHPNRFYEMNKKVLKTLLVNQLSTIPDSQLTIELEKQWNGIKLSEETPILNIYLLTQFFIEENSKKDILIPAIKEASDEYYHSIQFNETDKQNLIICPSLNSSSQVAPKSLVPFYYIKLIDCYWHQVISTNSTVTGFSLYSTWAESLLTAAPKIYSEDSNGELKNLYTLAVDKMLSNINNLTIELVEESKMNFYWAAVLFVEEAIDILSNIEKKHSEKITEDWLLEEITLCFEAIIEAKNKFRDNFNPKLEGKSLKSPLMMKAFRELSRTKYVLPKEKQNPGYEFLSSIYKE